MKVSSETPSVVADMTIRCNMQIGADFRSGSSYTDQINTLRISVRNLGS